MSVAPRAAAILAAIGLLTALTSPAVGLFATLVLAGAVAADALAVRRAPEVVRRVRSHLARGVTTPLHVEASPPGPGSVRLRQPAPAALAIEPREGVGRLEAAVTPRRRGRHTLGPVALRGEGPLGLGRWRHEGAGEQEVTVYPDVPAARRLALAVRQGRFRAAGRLTRGPLGLGTEFESIRDYEPDDDIRQVNWRASERMQRPMSNQYRVEQDREVMLLIDAGRLMASPLGDRTRLDVAVDAAVAVALVADVVGDRAGTLAFDRQVRRQLAPRRGGGHGAIRALLDLEPRAEEPDYELAFRSVEGAKRSLMLIFCDLLEETAARPLVDAVPVLSRRHGAELHRRQLHGGAPARLGDRGSRAAHTRRLAAVREDEPQQVADRSVLDRQADDRPDEAAVEDRQRGAAEAEQDAAGDGQERHLDVVGVDLAGQGGLLARRQVAGAARFGRALELPRHDPERRRRVVERPDGGERERHEEQREAEAQQQRALAHALPVAGGQEGPQRATPRLGGVHALTRVGDEPLEPAGHLLAGEQPSRQRQIGRRGAVAAPEPQQRLGAEALGPGAGLADERRELLPPRRPIPCEAINIHRQERV
jgi:uncharacterized protein (DUF58 family)